MKTTKAKAGVIGLAVVLAVVLGIVLYPNNLTVNTSTALTGNYGTVTVNGAGTAATPLTIDGAGYTVNCLRLSGSYIIASNFVVEGCGDHGVLITGKHITFKDSVVKHTAANNNSTAGTCKTGISSGWSSGIKVQVGGEDVKILNNSVYENCGEGIASTRGVDVLIENNYVRDSFSVNIYIDNSYRQTVRNNYTACSIAGYYRNGQPANGILLGQESYSGWGSQLHDVTLASNTIEKCKGVRLYNPTGVIPANLIINDTHCIAVYAAPCVNVSGSTGSGNVSVTATPQAQVTPAVTLTPTLTLAPTLTLTPALTSAPATATAQCVPALTVWVCDKKP